MAWSQLVDMEMDDESQLDTIGPLENPRFPYGLRICLTGDELDKLNLDIADCAVGDFVDLRAFATVTSISSADGPDGPCQRVELQIEKLALENETTEVAGE